MHGISIPPFHASYYKKKKHEFEDKKYICDWSKNELLREYEHFKHVFPLPNEFNLISLCDMNWCGPNMLKTYIDSLPN